MLTSSDHPSTLRCSCDSAAWTMYKTMWIACVVSEDCRSSVFDTDRVGLEHTMKIEWTAA